MKNDTNNTAGSDCPAATCSQFLPCPFCGSINIEVMYDDGYNVGCKDCSTYVAPFLGEEADDRQKHIDFWNTRAPISSANASDHPTASQKATTAEKWWAQHAALLAEKMKIGGVDSFKIQRKGNGKFEFEVTPTHFHDCTATTNGVGKITAPQRIG